MECLKFSKSAAGLTKSNVSVKGHQDHFRAIDVGPLAVGVGRAGGRAPINFDVA